MLNKIWLLILLLVGHMVCGQGLLWRVTGNGLTTPSYVYGTIHMICEQDFFYPDSTLSALTNTQQLYLEIDMSDMSAMMKAQSKMMLPKGQSLKTLLKAEDYVVLEKYFKETLQMNLGGVERLKPITLVSMIYPKLLNCPTKTYEMEFMRLAQQQKKPIKGLETIDSQLEVFDKIPYDKQAESLIEMVKEGGRSKRQFDKLKRAYRRQKTRKLYRMIRRSEKEMADFEDILLTNRNKAWIPLMQEAMQFKPTFFAVGAGHLAGPAGVLTLLKKAGYTVTPL